MMLLGFNGARSGFGDIGSPCAGMSPASMAIGDSCTLPDGSNIGVWNGSKLVAPDGSNIDAINASSLLASGSWNGSNIAGAPNASGGNQNAANAGQPWWSTSLSALAKGVTQGAMSPGTPGAIAPVAPPTPWYMTPIGMIGIVIALGLGYFVIKK